jgi:uncharacterized protein YacL
MLNIEATSRTSRAVIVAVALILAFLASTAVSGLPLLLRVLVSVLTFVVVGVIGLSLAPKRR